MSGKICVLVRFIEVSSTLLAYSALSYRFQVVVYFHQTNSPYRLCPPFVGYPPHGWLAAHPSARHNKCICGILGAGRPTPQYSAVRYHF